MPDIKRLCVYCGSSPGADPAYLAAASALGKTLAAHNIGLVYGGASIGLMGAVADATLTSGGEVYGVMPQSLADKEISHPGLTELIVTQSMHDRKQAMADQSDGFIALPGGLGTFEELFEIWTWAQLGFHQKPIGLLNITGFFDPLLTFLDQAAGSGFVKSAHREMLNVAAEPSALITTFRAYQPPSTAKLS